MSSGVMREQIKDSSPRFKARIAGVLYLIVIVTAGLAEIYVRGNLIVRGDAAATATNILSHQLMFRLGGAADLINLACDTALALLFYELLKPVNRSLALLAAFFRLIHVAILAVSTLAHFAPLIFLGGAHDLTVFSPEQLQEMVLVSIRLHTQGYNVTLFFFGFGTLLLGYLIFRSTYLPRILGVLLALAGLAYVFIGLANFVAPAFKARISLYILLPCGLIELSLTLWLLFMGVNLQRWSELSGAAANSDPLARMHT